MQVRILAMTPCSTITPTQYSNWCSRCSALPNTYENLAEMSSFCWRKMSGNSLDSISHRAWWIVLRDSLPVQVYSTFRSDSYLKQPPSIGHRAYEGELAHLTHVRGESRDSIQDKGDDHSCQLSDAIIQSQLLWCVEGDHGYVYLRFGGWHNYWY